MCVCVCVCVCVCMSLCVFKKKKKKKKKKCAPLCSDCIMLHVLVHQALPGGPCLRRVV